MFPRGHAHAILVAACLVAMAAAAGCTSQRAPAPPRVTINGKSWLVDLAVTPEQQSLGLAGRQQLSNEAGMLFVFRRAEVRNFCMRGCVIPLDIAFIGDDMRVVRTHTMAVEPDRAGRIIYSSDSPARYALETAAGSLEAAGVKVGDPVTFSGDIPTDK